MVAQRSVVLILAVLLLLSSPVPQVLARTPAGENHLLSVGLLSARDARPVALVSPASPSQSLSATLFPQQGAPVRRTLAGDVFLALESGGTDEPYDATPIVFSVQVASLASAEAAERFAEEVRRHWPESDVRVEVATLGDRRTTYRVMAGRFSDRNSALAFTTSLAAYGMDGAFVVQLDQPVAVAAAQRPLVLFSATTGLVTGLQRVTFSEAVPEQPSFLLDGEPYRGTLEVCGGSAGIMALNRVELEDYLKGVVPCELGPDRFPQLEALKAQAVTARTYALKHTGRHRGEGFDLCDTPHCQVYGGAGREHPLSSEAVHQTAGLAGFFQGELAETLYTSTCGGHTEISSAVFSGEAPAYLAGVPCTTGQSAGIEIARGNLKPPFEISERETGNDLGFSLGLLTALGIVEDGELGGNDDAGQGIGRAEAEKWIKRLLLRHGRDPEAAGGPENGDSSRLPNRGQLALQLCRALDWQERMDVLFTVEDLGEIIGSTGAGSEAEHRALACLVTAGIFHRHPDGSVAAKNAMSRGAFAAALARLVLHLEPDLLGAAALTGAGQGRLVLRTGEVVEPRVIAPGGIRLFEQLNTAILPITAGRFRIGDRVQVLLDRQWRALMLVRIPAAGGAAADRYSPYALWSIVVDCGTIEGLLEENGHRVGRLLDLQPLERGPTGRLTRLRVVGTRGSTVLRGLNIRWNLGTRENLFFIDRLPGRDGSVRAWRFTGRGWGHGVGMCQVGAAGMAEAGASFIDILQHYYPGISIEAAAGNGR